MARMDIGGITLNVRQWGRGVPLLLVHGLGGCTELWCRQVRPFAERHHVVALDVRGFGRSDKPADAAEYSIARVVDDILGVLDALGLESAHFLGSSMGGFFGLAAALRAPQRLRSLVLCHTGCRFGIPAEIVRARAAALEHQSMETYAALVVSQALAQPADPFVAEWLAEIIAANDRRPYARFLTEVLAGFDLSSRVAEIELPALVLGGARDRVIPVEFSHELHGLLRASRLTVLADVGHIGYAEDPAAFNNAVLDFLAERS